MVNICRAMDISVDATNRLFPPMNITKLMLWSVHVYTVQYSIVYTSSFIAIKMVFGRIKLNFSDFFEFSVSPTRGHAYKLYKYRCKSV